MPVVTDGGRGTGVEALGANFPFVDPSDDVRGLLADFYLSHEVRTAVLPLRVAWLHGFCRAQSSCGSEGSRPSDSPDPVHEADLVVKDAAGAVVFDSTGATYFDARNWGGRFRIYEWRTAGAVCRAVAHAGAGAAEAVTVYGFEIEPVDGTLDERTHEVAPRRVTSLEVNGEVFTGPVEVVQGYNVTLAPGTAAHRTRRARSRVVVGAAPGGGDGRYPSCEEPEQVVRRINGVGPRDGGDFALSAAGCYWVERPVTDMAGGVAVVTPAALRLNNNCGPCCECSDYEHTYQGIRRLHARFRELGQRAEAVRGGFKGNIERWQAERACRMERPTRAAAAAMPMGYLGVAGSYCNTDDDCKYELDLKIAVAHNNDVDEDNPKTISLVPCTTMVSRSTGGSERKEPYYEDPNVWGNFWEFLDRGRALTMRARFQVAWVESGDSVTVTVTPYLAGVAQPAAVTTVSLYPCGA